MQRCAVAREAFISAQTSSCRHKDRRAKDIIRQHNDEAATVRFAKGLLKCIARMLVRLSVLWDFRENGKTPSAEIAQDLHCREFSFCEKILLLLRQSRGERDRTTAMGILWNRCLRKIFISVVVNTVDWMTLVKKSGDLAERLCVSLMRRPAQACVPRNQMLPKDNRAITNRGGNKHTS